MSLVRRLKKKLNSFAPHQDLPRFDAVFADGWKTYRLENLDHIDRRFADLLRGMDDISGEIARTVFQRYTELAPPVDQDAVIRFVPDRLFTAYEKALQIEFSAKMAALDKAKIRLPDVSTTEFRCSPATTAWRFCLPNRSGADKTRRRGGRI